MFGLRALSAAIALLLMLLASACGSDSAPGATTSSETQAESTTVNETQPEATAVDQVALETAAESEPPDPVFEKFDPGNFDDPTTIDNAWFPMQPGTQWVYEGSTEEGGLTIPHRIIFTVTDLTKVIEGVRTVVALVEDYSNEQLVEAELAFYAQDNDGKVWYLGEYPEEYENGRFIDAPAWIAGFQGARAGIMMQAAPQAGTPSYSQGWGPAVNWTDYGRVDEIGLGTCVPVDCYEDVLVIAESSLEEANAFQLKYYAPGVGNVQVGWRGADATKETLELVELVQLSPEALAEVREQALALEERAYEIRPDAYGQTPRAEPLGTAESS